jgi:hypothetical protein
MMTDPDGAFVFNGLRSNTNQLTVVGGPDYQIYRESVILEVHHSPGSKS